MTDTRKMNINKPGGTRASMSIGFVFLFISISITLPAQFDSIRINEFMALNQTTITDEDAEYSDWIEIFNSSSEIVNLRACKLTDLVGDPRKWSFPDTFIGPGEYLLLFASGKDRAIPGQELHTNFRISGAGEYLGLFDPDGEIISEFYPSFPVQQSDISYGFYDGTYMGFRIPTPGQANNYSSTIIPLPELNPQRGLFQSPFDLYISSDLTNAEIYYTLDGSLPDDENGFLYTSELHIDKTTIIRAVSIADNGVAGNAATHSYLFPDDVIHQPNDPPGYPLQWGPYKSISGFAIGDYEMDPEMVADPGFADRVKAALFALPVVSLASDRDNFFSPVIDPDSGGIYIYTGATSGDSYEIGRGWKRLVSFEFIENANQNSVQVDCGISLQGGASRNPEKSPKHSFRLTFSSEYGPSKLSYPLFHDEAAVSRFDNLVLRAGFNQSWVHWSNGQRIKAQYIRDIWNKDTQRAMGHPSSRSVYAHLYINGIYWGIYAPSERMDNDFAESYLGGEEEDWDVIKDYAEVADGDINAWNEMMGQAQAGLESDEAYQRIQGNNPDGTASLDIESMVDVVNLADYMILNFYGGNTDWDHHNWAAMRNRVKPGKGFRFFCWDAEHTLKTLNENVTGENNSNRPSQIFRRLTGNEEFLRLFADRVQRYCSENGLLTPGPASERWIQRMNMVEPAVDAEAARWGDYRRDVHNYKTAGPFDLYTKDSYWDTEKDFILNTYFPQRTEIFLEQLRGKGLIPDTPAPVLRLNDNLPEQKWISSGDILSMSTEKGIIYYTRDGSDPVIWNANIDESSKVLIPYDSDKKVIVPKSDIGSSWRAHLAFDDAAWLDCKGLPGGIGYEKKSGYQNLISLDVSGDMYQDGSNPNNSCYIRIPFVINSGDLSELKNLILNIQYDDGFAAYLNGVKVADANASTYLSWNSAATSGHEGNTAETFNISQHLGALTEGENLLSIQGLNEKTSSSDFLIQAELLAGNNDSAPVSPGARMYSEPFALDGSCHIMARSLNLGEWSALNEKFFILPDDFHDIKITEIHYHPLDQDTINDVMFEFIELKNTGTSTLDLGGTRFIDGINYTFPEETELGPNGFIVLASDERNFFNRYGFVPFDEYSGQLNNIGEWLLLVDPVQDSLCVFYYNLDSSWPALPDGQGYSLVPTEFNPSNDQTNPLWWRASHRIGGSPGMDDVEFLSDEVMEMIPARGIIMSQNYPNPFSDLTHIYYELPEDAFVQLSVINMLGQEVIKIVNQKQLAGSYTVPWNAVDRNHNNVTAGFYFYRIVVKSSRHQIRHTRKMLLIKR